MICKNTKLKNVLLFKREYFEDHRGTYEPLYVKNIYTDIIKEKTGDTIEFLEDDFAVSRKHVLRGLHGDDRTWKYVTCLKGKYFINVLCYDKESEFYGKYQSFVLSSDNKKQLLIPPWHGHGYVVMSEDAIFYYQQSCIYKGMEEQFSIKYNDERFNMWWPIKNPIVSKRDETGTSIQ